MSNKKAQEKKQASNWGNAEPFVHWVGRLCWAFIVGALTLNAYFLITHVINIIRGAYSPATLSFRVIPLVVWFSISVGMLVVSLIMYGIKFSNLCKEYDWETPVNNVIHFGTLRVPKMLFFGIITGVFGFGFGAAGFIVPFILLITMGPTKVDWKEEGK
ncbi:MAG: hypothetical protein ACFFCS_27965 [Candidatus Hodarchaeota archaeon]